MTSPSNQFTEGTVPRRGTALSLSSNNNANGKENGPRNYNDPSTSFRLIPGLGNAAGGILAGALDAARKRRELEGFLEEGLRAQQQ